MCIAGRSFVAAVALSLVAACGSGDDGAAPAAAALPQGSEPFALDAATFTTEIDNPYWPMTPGTRWTYVEIDDEGTRLEVVVTATSATKRIANGVTALVVRDTVTEDGAIVEDTLDWYAQDAAGNIWYLGEETAEFEDGRITTRDGSWEAGVDGALAGVAVPADPRAGMSYRQEYYAGHAEDNGEVLAVDHQVDVAAGHYADAMLTQDTNALEPDVLEYKLYAPGVGVVLALGISGGGDREELVSMRTVGARAARLAGTAPLGHPYP